jgi:hypothetical protein
VREGKLRLQIPGIRVLYLCDQGSRDRRALGPKIPADT